MSNAISKTMWALYERRTRTIVGITAYSENVIRQWYGGYIDKHPDEFVVISFEVEEPKAMNNTQTVAG